MERVEKEIIYTPIAAFKFWEQQDFKELLNEVMDKSSFFKFSLKEEKVQGIGNLLLDIFKIRQINLLLMQPEIASKFFNQKWTKPITGYRIIKSMCKLKCAGIKKMFKELPIIFCDNDVTKTTYYLITALMAYKATAKVIFNRLLNVTRVCQIIKPLLQYKEFSWTHQAIFTLIRSAPNIFRMKLLREFYDLKSELLENKENNITDIEGESIEEKTINIINWFMFNDISNEQKNSILFDSRNVNTINSGKQHKGAKKTSYEAEERQKSISIASTQEEEHMQKAIGCRFRMRVGYGDNGKWNATIVTTKEEVDHQFWYPKKNKVIKDYKNIKDSSSWDDEFEIESE